MSTVNRLSILSAVTLYLTKLELSSSTTYGNCGNCNSDTTNDFESIVLSNLDSIEYSSGIFVYDFNGEWEPEDGCSNDRTWYTREITNTIYDAEETFDLVWQNDQWAIRKRLYSTAWAYCNKDSLDDCQGEWYQYQLGNWNTLDSDSITTVETSDDCGEAGDGATPSPTSKPTESTSCGQEYDCIQTTGFWYDGINGYWEVQGCMNDEPYYECLDCSDYEYQLFYSTAGDYNEWLMAFSVSDTLTRSNGAIAYCDGSNSDNDDSGDGGLVGCNDGNWYVVYVSDTSASVSGESDSTCDGRSDNNDDDTSDTEDDSIIPYGYEADDETSSSSNDSDDEGLQWWAWLLIGIAIASVLVIIGVLAVKQCRGGKKQVGYDANDDKNFHLLADK